MEDKKIKEFLEKVFDLYDQAPPEISFSASAHGIKREQLPDRVKYSKPSKVGITGWTVDYDNNTGSGFEVNLFMAPEIEK